jgi:hypothetical protein
MSYIVYDTIYGQKMDHVKPVLCNKYNDCLIVNINISITLIVLINK